MGGLLLAIMLLANGAAGARVTAGADAPDPLDWPKSVERCRPWARWWWLGSAIDRENLTRLLEQYHEAGIGGVEICPIYGAKGYEARYIEFLSPRWIEMLRHTTAEAGRLGMGVDLTTGTGWPFGGPSVQAVDASSRVVLKRYSVAGGAVVTQKLPDGRVLLVRAVADQGRQIDLTDRVKDRLLDWTAPTGNWRVYVALESGPVQKVKRAAPGGAGYVLDPFSPAAMSRYLQGFEKVAGLGIRAEFHDSYEYYNADWTPDLFDQFAARRDYDLRTRLPELFGDGADDDVARVKHDYRQTVSELHLSYIRAWSDWAHQHGQMTREQAHGAPANLPDLYAAADISETELQFGDVNERQIPMLKFASSAAHVTNKPLSSSESFTWLGEHFQVSLADVKPAADLFFLSGANQIVLHGIPYSPRDVKWPGWLFYAAVNFGPEGGLWHDLPVFNAYAARCQSVLREGRPDEDVLLYFPIHDIWQSPRGMLIPMGVGDQNRWLWNQPVYRTAMKLWEAGIGFDFVSDAQARRGRGDQVLLVPECRLMPPKTAGDLLDFARDGGTVVFEGPLPADVPGMSDLQSRRERLRQALAPIANGQGSSVTMLGKGRVFVGGDLVRTLRQAGVHQEPMTAMGLRFIRRRNDGGWTYFIVNRQDRTIDGWVPLGRPAKSAVILDPRFAARSGFVAVRQRKDGLPEVFLQMQPAESRVLRTLEAARSGRPWIYARTAGEGIPIAGTRSIRFVEGGPALPADTRTATLDSWTKLGDDNARRFAGTARYVIDFDGLAAPADDRLLSLGRVCESARVRLNGKDLATLWCAPFEVRLGDALRPGRNRLEIDVTNLAANRIADLDRRHVPWKSFHEINFVNRNYKPFDASAWPPRDSGLLGPVKLVRLNAVRP